eukprot:358637-Chlamydomonas_euryale.AAC.2
MFLLTDRPVLLLHIAVRLSPSHLPLCVPMQEAPAHVGLPRPYAHQGWQEGYQGPPRPRPPLSGARLRARVWRQEEVSRACYHAHASCSSGTCACLALHHSRHTASGGRSAAQF